MKNTMTVFTLMLVLLALVPCCSFAAGTLAAASAAPQSPAPVVAGTAPTAQQPGQDFMAWLERQPGQSRQERASICVTCLQRGEDCCFGDLNTRYCGSPGC